MNEKGNEHQKKAVLKTFQQLPGIGKVVAEDLWNIGLRSIDDLKAYTPDELYQRLCDYQGTRVDRCMLYTLRCVAYAITTAEPDPPLLKWWNWTDERMPRTGAEPSSPRR
jgi:hypothetical protein